MKRFGSIVIAWALCAAAGLFSPNASAGNTPAVSFSALESYAFRADGGDTLYGLCETGNDLAPSAPKLSSRREVRTLPRLFKEMAFGTENLSTPIFVRTCRSTIPSGHTSLHRTLATLRRLNI